jgi:dUTP pyrophosphatase
MLEATFFTLPGDVLFVPKVAHPKEDAGADIRAHVKNSYDRLQAIDFANQFQRQKPVASPLLKPQLFVDGIKQSAIAQDSRAFADSIDEKDGAAFLLPGQTLLINSGFKLVMASFEDILPDFLIPVYQIVSRSGLACKHNVVVTNSPGIIDKGYRDWVKVSLTNYSHNFHAFTHGARIAQGLYNIVIDQSGNQWGPLGEEMGGTSRGEGGFGSTNV